MDWDNENETWEEFKKRKGVKNSLELLGAPQSLKPAKRVKSGVNLTGEDGYYLCVGPYCSCKVQPEDFENGDRLCLGCQDKVRAAGEVWERGYGVRFVPEV